MADLDAVRQRRLADPPEARDEAEGVEPGRETMQPADQVAERGGPCRERDRQRPPRPRSADGQRQPAVEEPKQAEAEHPSRESSVRKVEAEDGAEEGEHD